MNSVTAHLAKLSCILCEQHCHDMMDWLSKV